MLFFGLTHMAINDDNLNEAIVVYIGTEFCPQSYGPRLLLEKFGQDLGAELVGRVRKLLKELDEFKPDWNIHSLDSAAEWAIDEIQKKHPELNQQALDALFRACRFGYL